MSENRERELQRQQHREAVDRVLADIGHYEFRRGDHGIIVRMDEVGLPATCMKYYFAPNAYEPGVIREHQRAFELGHKVPGPFFEFNDRKSVTMQFIDGAENLNILLLERNLKLAPEVMEATAAVLRKLNDDFLHNDPRLDNFLLANREERDGVIIRGEPWIVDLDNLRALRFGGKGEEWKRFRNLLRMHTIR